MNKLTGIVLILTLITLSGCVTTPEGTTGSVQNYSQKVKDWPKLETDTGERYSASLNLRNPKAFAIGPTTEESFLLGLTYGLASKPASYWKQIADHHVKTYGETCSIKTFVFLTQPVYEATFDCPTAVE